MDKKSCICGVLCVLMTKKCLLLCFAEINFSFLLIKYLKWRLQDPIGLQDSIYLYSNLYMQYNLYSSIYILQDSIYPSIGSYRCIGFPFLERGVVLLMIFEISEVFSKWNRVGVSRALFCSMSEQVQEILHICF